MIHRTDLIHLLAVALCALLPAAAHATHAPQPDTITTPNQSYIVNFSNDNPYSPPAAGGDDLNYFPTAQAQVVANALDSAISSAHLTGSGQPRSEIHLHADPRTKSCRGVKSSSYRVMPKLIGRSSWWPTCTAPVGRCRRLRCMDRERRARC